ncbi:MAG TPA: orotidine-5'-phosphate decarboxylase [Candidatus Angelobacter sp.]|nr:orotidine-5'-phosphate decarboxylase [Candidatus Angelobacter sp.]
MSPKALQEFRERLIVALDVPTASAAQRVVQQLGESVSTYKVGLQLFTAEGPAVVRELVAAGRTVFLDLKIHDIPNTVAHAVKSAVDSGAKMLTVHASGGAAVLRAAVEAANHRLSILAVTVLTSLNDEDMQEIGFAGTTVDEALRMAALARSTGCDAVVTSAREVGAVRRMLGEGFGIVVPGIRPLGASQDDQSRVATPAQAIQAGATQIVVGRPITRAADPIQAVNAILEEMAGAVVGR